MDKELQVELMRRNGTYCVLTPEGCRFQARILDRREASERFQIKGSGK